ncbi:MAG: isopenicillin N synthase family dioxygenase [Sphingobium sp.]
MQSEPGTGIDTASQDNNGKIAADRVPSSLPAIDISRMHGTESERSTFIRDLRHILHEHGFFYLHGHGVAPSLIEEIISASKQFFALPEKDKLAIEITRSPQFRGYTRAGMEITAGQQDWREQVDFDREEETVAQEPGTPAWKRAIGPNQWPAAMPGLKSTILRYQEEMTRVAIDVLKAIALALGQDENVFEPMYAAGPRQHLKILRYPGRDSSGSNQGVGAHKDGGLVTILLQDVLPGLRVQAQDGSWVDAPPVPGSFVVNTGELLELATNGFVRADVHAAITPPAGTERFSVPFFLGASLEGSIPFIDLPPELKRVERGVSTEADNPLFRDVGQNHLKARLRSHPDVAAIHYADVA